MHEFHAVWNLCACVCKNLKEEIRKNTTQLTEKIADTNIFVYTLEIKEQ